MLSPPPQSDKNEKIYKYFVLLSRYGSIRKAWRGGRMMGKKNKILLIEIKDENINKQLCKLIIHIEKTILALKGILEQNKPGDEKTEIENLYTAFLRLHRELEIIGGDILSIMNEEGQKKDLVRLKDEGFLQDKQQQIHRMKHHLNELIQMLETRPTEDELEQDLLNKMVDHVNDVIEAMNAVIQDDKELEKVYQRVQKSMKSAA